MSTRPRYQKIFFSSTILLSLILSIFIAVSFVDRGHYFGDGPSNDAAWFGGMNFNRYGFIAMRGIPVQTPDLTKVPEIPAKPGETPFYFHYPAGPDLMQGVLFRLGLESRLSHQFVAILITILAGYFAWLSLAAVFDTWAALIAFAFLVLTPSWLFFADNLHGHAYLALLHWYFLYQITTIFTAIKKGKAIHYWKKTGLFFLLGLIGSWFSIDLVPPFLILGLVCFFIIPGKNRWTWGIVLTMSALVGDIVGFMLHVYKNGLVLGGFKAAIDDFLNVFIVRAGHVVTKVTFVNYDMYRHWVKFLLGQQWFFTFLFLAMALAGWFWTLSQRKKENGFWWGLFISSLIGTFFWQFFMKQHAMIHAFTYRHTEVLAVYGVGLFCQRKWKTPLLSIAIIYLVGHAVLGVFQVEGTPVKRVLVKSLVSESDRGRWACIQDTRLRATTELSGAKQIVTELKPQSCVSVSMDGDGLTSRLAGHLAEVVLFWR